MANEVKTPIPARLYNAAVGGHVAGADDIIDDKTGMVVSELVGNKSATSEENPFNGMGVVILPMNIQEVEEDDTTVQKNILTQEMMSAQNTKYVIKYDYTLGEDITVPNNCVLEFDGGAIANGTLVGNDTVINYSKPFLDNVVLQGSFVSYTLIKDVNIFKIINYTTSQVNSLLRIKGINDSVILSKGTYNDFETIIIDRNVDLDFSESTIYLKADGYSQYPLINMPFGNRDAVNLYDKVYVSNATIIGGDNAHWNDSSHSVDVIGDAESRRVIQISKVSDVKLKNINLSKAFCGTIGWSKQPAGYENRLPNKSIISIFGYDTCNISDCVMSEIFCDNIIVCIPNLNIDNQLTFRNNKSYHNVTGLLCVFDARLHAVNNSVEDFTSSAFNVFCYDSIIEFNTFKNGYDSTCIDLTEAGEYVAKNVEICFNNAQNTGNSICDVCGDDVFIHDNFTSSVRGVDAFLPKTNVENAETESHHFNNPFINTRTTNFENLIIKNNVIRISSGSCVSLNYIGNAGDYTFPIKYQNTIINGNSFGFNENADLTSTLEIPIKFLATHNCEISDNDFFCYGHVNPSNLATVCVIQPTIRNSVLRFSGILKIVGNTLSYSGVGVENFLLKAPSNATYSDFIIFVLSNISTLDCKVYGLGNLFVDNTNKNVNSDTTNAYLFDSSFPNVINGIIIGQKKFDTRRSQEFTWNGTRWLLPNGQVGGLTNGHTSYRPAFSAPTDNDVYHIGYMYFDTALGKPIFWNGTTWVDATGTPV